ncbi:MAG TPA: glycoside hydrolase family 43 protein [Chryseosolibacter sp.]|nr:glycoside hydrolase family 43 protein [Chryseosolibacter sp.]
MAFVILVILVACRADQGLTGSVGHVDTFTNPLLPSGADPWIEEKDNWYYFTHTTGRNLRLYRTKKVSELGQAEVKIVWNPPSTGMNSKQIWAPEIHHIDGKWYFYYAADDGLNENHRMWVLENASADPFTGTWVDKGKLALPDDKWAIDGTAFEHDGQLYFLWSGWEGDVNVQQDIYITKMTNPWTPVGPRVRLSKPEYDWETRGVKPTINEAPQFLARNGKLFIIYSASGCWTDDYTLGMLSAEATSDPMDAASWTKHPEPLFEKSTTAQAYGPGHNSFFISPDGSEDWIIYHANPESGQGCGGKRSPRMQKFEWTDDGFPVFGEPVALGAAIPVPSGE